MPRRDAGQGGAAVSATARRSLSRQFARRSAPPDLQLPQSHVAIRWLEYECPACEGLTAYCADQLHEDDAGWIAPDGPDRYPICPDCQTQFECPPVRLMTAPRIK